MSNNMFAQTAREIAVKATVHADNNRVPEAVYLYQLSITFIDKAVACTQDAQVNQILLKTKAQYREYIDSHNDKSTAPQVQPAPTPPTQTPLLPTPSNPAPTAPAVTPSAQPIPTPTASPPLVPSTHPPSTVLPSSNPSTAQTSSNPSITTQPPVNPTPTTFVPQIALPSTPAPLPPSTNNSTQTATVPSTLNTNGTPTSGSLTRTISMQPTTMRSRNLPNPPRAHTPSPPPPPVSVAPRPPTAAPPPPPSSQNTIIVPPQVPANPIPTATTPTGAVTSPSPSNPSVLPSPPTSSSTSPVLKRTQTTPDIVLGSATTSTLTSNTSGVVGCAVGSLSIPAQQHLSHIKEALNAQRTIATLPRDATEEQRETHDGVTALWKADDFRKAGNSVDAIKQYEVCIDHLLRAISVGDSRRFKRKVSRLSLQPQLTDTEPREPLQMSSYCTTIDFVNDTVQLHERLGGGGSGATVYRCTCGGLTFVAKLMPGDMMPEMKKALLAEIAVMHSLDHPNIVKYLGHDLSKPKEIRLYMEYYTDTLSGVIKQHFTKHQLLPPRQIAQWGFQIAKGLKYLHSLTPPIIHRDLKSENVFVTRDPQNQVQFLKIGDFDTAKVIEAAKLAYTKNTGTLGYMAPEVVNPSEKGYSDKADIWSFGMVLYELIVLQQPYYNFQHFEIWGLCAKGERPTFHEVSAERMAEIADIVKLFNKCTDFNPAIRPTAKKLINKLSQFI
ncbi:Serine/threonine-protein kinase CTR1 [Pelomyxa schiedti]|nr:Serine/threonine-protein kinase CTR1 [Pelomyxa schiedti]